MSFDVVLSDRRGLVSCSGKRCYDFSGARKLAKRMRRNQDRNVEHYHCHHCHNWHIGTLLKRHRRRAETRHAQGQVRSGE